MSEPNIDTTPDWLKDLQQKSWEPEILLSGIVLYGMFQVPGYLDQFLIYFKSNIFGQVTDLDNMIAVFKVGVYWLIVGLVLHLISRGIWVGLVGLSFIFPFGIRHDRTNFAGRFQEKVENLSSIELSIIQLEKVSSSLFSVSFMLFMCLVGGYLYMFIFVILPFLLLVGVFNQTMGSDAVQNLQYIALPVVILGLFAMFDFVSLGLLRKIKWLERVYWPFHRVISTLTLSRFYSKVYFTFATNTNKWLFSSVLVLFILTSVFGATSSASERYNGDLFSRIELWHHDLGNMVYPGHYADDHGLMHSNIAHIQSDLISGNTIKLFVAADIDLEDSIKSYNKLAQTLVGDSRRKEEIHLSAIANFYHLFLDDSLIESKEWFYYYQSNTRQRGYITYIDVSKVTIGNHRIRLSPPPAQYGDRSWADIKFYRE